MSDEKTKIILTDKQRQRIEFAVKMLNEVRQELDRENPGHNVNWYLEDSSNLNLMDGDSHDDAQRPMRNRIIGSFIFWNASGGGW